MVISNLKIGTSYFFTPLEEFAKENIRYQILPYGFILNSGVYYFIWITYVIIPKQALFHQRPKQTSTRDVTICYHLSKRGKHAKKPPGTCFGTAFFSFCDGYSSFTGIKGFIPPSRSLPSFSAGPHRSRAVQRYGKQATATARRSRLA